MTTNTQQILYVCTEVVRKREVFSLKHFAWLYKMRNAVLIHDLVVIVSVYM